MIIITRKMGEAITIDDDIKISIKAIQGRYVTLFVNWPGSQELDQTSHKKKLGESISPKDDIKVTLLGIHGRSVRLGIEAPNNTVIHRQEIYVKIQAENRKIPKIQKRRYKPKKRSFLKKTINSFGRWLVKISQ